MYRRRRCRCAATKSCCGCRIRCTGQPFRGGIIAACPIAARDDLLGYPSYAAYQFRDHMAESPERVWAISIDDSAADYRTGGAARRRRGQNPLLGRPWQAGDFQFLVYHLRGRPPPGQTRCARTSHSERVATRLFISRDHADSVWQFTAAHVHSGVASRRRSLSAIRRGWDPVGIGIWTCTADPGKPLSNSTASVRLGVRGRECCRAPGCSWSFPQPRAGEPVLLGSELSPVAVSRIRPLAREPGDGCARGFARQGLPAEFDFRRCPPSSSSAGDATQPYPLIRHDTIDQEAAARQVSSQCCSKPDETRTGLGVRGCWPEPRMSLALHERAIRDQRHRFDRCRRNTPRPLGFGRSRGHRTRRLRLRTFVAYEAAYYTYSGPP